MSIITTNGNRWHQLNLWCDTWQTAEQTAVAHLHPILAEAERSGVIGCWWFLRKAEQWRLRLLPADGQDRAAGLVEKLTRELTERGAIRRWAEVIYEPELHAFGGPEAMAISYQLFHADSHHILTHLARAHSDHRRELGLLLATRLMRGAGQEWYEQGDIWAQVASHRTGQHQGEPSPATLDAVRQLITATADTTDSPLHTTPEWPAAFQTAGRDLADLAERGLLTRGLRAVLAHHILFAINRLGIPTRQQHQLAVAATAVVLRPRSAHPAGVTYGPTVGHATSVNAVTNSTSDAALDPTQLRTALVAHLRGLGAFQTPAVGAAFGTVPRHLFLPGMDIQTAYAPQVVVTKRTADGTAISSASSPYLVATMLEQLHAQPGHRVLEIGTATGINAALLAELVGPTGEVVTVEIDDDLVAGARTALAAAGYPKVDVICGDGADGDPDRASYDRIIVTAGAWDLPAAWWQQLAMGGRLVVPLRLHAGGLTRSLGFEYQQPGRMVATQAQMCGFVPLRGASQHAERFLQLADDITLHVDADQLTDQAELAQALQHPRHEQWTGIHVHDDDPVAHLDLWLVTTSGTGFGRLAVGTAARRRGLADPALRWGGASLHEGATLAYLAARPLRDELVELGVIAHGPHSGKLATYTSDLLHQWNQDRPAQPIITAHRGDTPEDQLAPGTRINRPETVLTVAWYPRNRPPSA